MEFIHGHQNPLRIQLIFLISLFISLTFSTADTVTTAETLNDVRELNVKLTSLTTIVERLLKESKIKENQLEELKSQWLQELKTKDLQIEILQQRVSDLEGRKDMQAESVKQENVNPEHQPKQLVNYQNGRNTDVTHRIHKSKYIVDMYILYCTHCIYILLFIY